MKPQLELTRAQKAAAILVAMGKPAASRLLKFFKQEELKSLIEGARQLKTIPQSELERIVSEFEAEFTEGVGLLDSADEMDTILSDSLSSDQVDAIMGRKPQAGQPGPTSVWIELEKIAPEQIGAFLSGEHPQTAALALSKLAPSTAASVVLTLAKTFRADVVRRMATLAVLPEPALAIIEKDLRARLLSEKASRDTGAGRSRVANLLNEIDKTQLDEIMADLEETGVPDLDAIKARLFAFEDIVLLSQKARLTLFDGISSEVVTMALRNSSAPLVEAVLSSIGARMRRMIEAELGEGSDGVAMADILQARKTIASTAIRLADQGVIELPSMQQAA